MFDVVQVMLLSDGSVTRHLQLLTDLPVQVVTPSDHSSADLDTNASKQRPSLAAALQHICSC